jgi:hypothetical protein
LHLGSLYGALQGYKKHTSKQLKQGSAQCRFLVLYSQDALYIRLSSFYGALPPGHGLQHQQM